MPNPHPTAPSSIPIRHSQWTSIWMGALAAVLAAVLAIALAGLLVLAARSIDGALVVLAGACVAFGGFFASVPWQRRAARAWHARQPGLILDHGRLIVPLAAAATLTLERSQPYALQSGWVDESVPNGASRTRNRLTYAWVTQGAVQIMFVADDSLRAARSAGWPRTRWPALSEPRVRLWSADLVDLIEALRATAPA